MPDLQALRAAAAGLGDDYIAPQLRAALEEADFGHCALARNNSAAFASYVLRNEETAQPVILSDTQIDWHARADHFDRLLLWAHVEAGKTQNMSIARVLYAIGRNTNLRSVVVSNTDMQAQKIARSIGSYIETSEELHRVFPKLQRDKSRSWNQHSLFVKRSAPAKDPTVTTCGIHGNILGARIDLLILDDILDYENTLTQHQRDDLANWYQATLEGRLTRNARVICVGTAWHRDDFMHRLAKQKNWHARRYPVLDRLGRPTWDDQFPMSRIQRRREDLSPLEFSRQMMCVARSDEDARFKREWIDSCLDRGDGRSVRDRIVQLPPGYKTFTGVDLGLGYKNSDLTVFFTLLLYPNGDREVLNVQSGRWSGPEIIQKIVDIHHDYGSEIIVENNGAQDFIVQFTKKMSAVPVVPYTTTSRTFRGGGAEYGIEGMATEFYNAKWIIPSRGRRSNSEIEAWIQEVLYYDPNAHPGDRLMASFFAREAARKERPVVEFGRI